MRPAVEAEKIGIASVVVTTTGFTRLARIGGNAGGIKDLRVAEYPGPIGVHDAAEIEDKVTTVLFDQVLEALTKPAEHTIATESTAWDPREIVCSGTSAEVNQFFSDRDWTDGLPIVPPTLEAVERFLQYTDQPADKVIAVLPSANLQAVPWNIAVNAIMAGCRPEHMPLLIAAVQALGDDKYNLNSIGSTSALLPYVFVNGPIVKQLGIEYSAQLISRGANPAIGRAIGLIVRNIAGFRPGETYMGTFGYPLVFTLAEDEERSPWEPFHVEHGFDKDVSTVTIGITNNWGPAPSCFSAGDKTAAQAALEVLCKEIAKKVRLVDFPGIGPEADKAMITVLMSPPIAQSLADAGYSKHDVKAYLYENTRISLREFEWVTMFTTTSQVPVREKAQAGVYPEEYLGAPEDLVRLLSSPEIVHVIVCGDANRNRVMTLEGGHAEPTTKEICLPPNWDELISR